MYLPLERDFGRYGAQHTAQPITRPSPSPKAPAGVRVDLAMAIGTRRWWRGLATCAGLCAATLMLSPLAQQAPRAGAQQTPGVSARPGAAFGLRQTRLGKGEALHPALVRLGLAEDVARAVARAAQRALPAGAPVPGTRLALTLAPPRLAGGAARFQRLDLRIGFDTLLRVDARPAGLTAHRLRLAVDHRPVRLTGPMGASLYHSLRAAGAPFPVVQAYLQAIATHVDFATELDPQTRFDLVVARDQVATGETRYGALIYAGVRNASRTLDLLYWTVNAVPGWYDAAMVSTPRTGMVLPVQATRISSGFGLRFHPLLRYSRLHRGVDYAAGPGTPIHAATDGLVTQAGWAGGYGQMVRLAHAGGLATGYAHMNSIAVRAGTRVVQGQIIGTVGSTGLSTGPHLHFEVYRDGVAVDPAGARFERQALLSGPDLAAFQARLHAVRAIAPLNAPHPAGSAGGQGTAPQ